METLNTLLTPGLEPSRESDMTTIWRQGHRWCPEVL